MQGDVELFNESFKIEGMKIEQQVCTVEQAKKLDKLGIKQDSIFHWQTDGVNEVIRRNTAYERQLTPQYFFSAFTVAEFGVMLPAYFDETEDKPFDMQHSGSNTWLCCYAGETTTIGTTEAQSRAKMLIYLLENNHVTAEQVNQKLNS